MVGPFSTKDRDISRSSLTRPSLQALPCPLGLSPVHTRFVVRIVKWDKFLLVYPPDGPLSLVPYSYHPFDSSDFK